MRARSPAYIDRHRIDDLSVDFCFEAAKTNVRGLMIAATRRAPGPVNRQGIHVSTEFFLERLRKRDGAALRFDQGEVAIVRPNASNQSAHFGFWLVLERFDRPAAETT